MEDGYIPMKDGRRFRVKEAGPRWEIEYQVPLKTQAGGWMVQAVKPVYDEAVWLLWQKVSAPQA
jgi:hypothetical protein